MFGRSIIAVSTFALMAAFSPSAHAADWRLPAPVYVAPEPQPVAAPRGFDWGRCYGGVQAGNKIVDNKVDLSRTDWFVAEYIMKSTVTMTGPVIGGQIGCNAMLRDGFLVGFELEGLWGKKNQNGCQTQIDPVSYCLDRFKEKEAFATIRFGYVIDNAFLCQCLNGLMVYGRAGVGSTNTDLRMNVNALSYYHTPLATNPQLTTPQYAENYDLRGSKKFISPVLGFGIERAISENWTVRMDFSSMFSVSSSANMTISKINYPQDRNLDGTPLPDDATGLKRYPKVGDVMPIKMQEVETKLTFGVNRLF